VALWPGAVGLPDDRCGARADGRVPGRSSGGGIGDDRKRRTGEHERGDGPVWLFVRFSAYATSLYQLVVREFERPRLSLADRGLSLLGAASVGGLVFTL
jgi:hypothetical protein